MAAKKTTKVKLDKPQRSVRVDEDIAIWCVIYGQIIGKSISDVIRTMVEEPIRKALIDSGMNPDVIYSAYLEKSDQN